jgi:hypothetical protein
MPCFAAVELVGGMALCTRYTVPFDLKILMRTSTRRGRRPQLFRVNPFDGDSSSSEMSFGPVCDSVVSKGFVSSLRLNRSWNPV